MNEKSRAIVNPDEALQRFLLIPIKPSAREKLAALNQSLKDLRRKQRPQFFFIQLSFAAYACADVESERPNFLHGLPHILRLQSTSQKDRNLNLFSNLTTQTPIVPPPSSAKFFNREFRIPRVEQNRVHMPRHRDRLFDGLLPGHVHDLHNRDSRQCRSQIFVRTLSQTIHKLDRIGTAAALLRDDAFRILQRGEQKRCDRWRD